MIYYDVLFSRTLSRDYRWLVIPDGCSDSDLELLKKLFNLYDNSKKMFWNSLTLPFYCINTLYWSYLIQCNKTPYTDQHGRPTFGLYGIAVSYRFRRHFWLYLPVLLRYLKTINPWECYDYYDMDDHSKFTSEIHELDMKCCDNDISTFLPSDSTFPTLESIRFNVEGSESIVKLLSNPEIGLCNIAFGASVDMVKDFNFSIAVLASDTSQNCTNIAIDRLKQSVPDHGEIENETDIQHKSPAKKHRKESILDRFDPVLQESTYKKTKDQHTSQSLFMRAIKAIF